MCPWFDEHLMQHIPGAAWNPMEDFVVRICMHFGECAKFSDYVVACANAFIQQAACTPANAKTLFFALEMTGEDKYRQAIQQVMDVLDAQQAEASLQAQYETLPFRMAYEMKLNRMERVGQTAMMFRSAHEHAKAAQDASVREKAWFLLGLTDAIATCSDQLYEHWRTLVDIYRERLSCMLRAAADADAQTVAIILWALLAGVEMGLIDPERYLPVACKLLASLRQNGEAQAADVLESVFGVK